MNFDKEIILTADGSKTIFLKNLNESYHSKHGSIQEAYHVFIKNGLDKINKNNEIFIIEFGLGTFLNALISLFEAENKNQKVFYTGIEKFPITENEFFAMDFFESIFCNYPTLQNRKTEFLEYYKQLFYQNWNVDFVRISPNFYFKKLNQDFLKLSIPENEKYDLVFFDAFGVRVQPELWDEKLFSIVYQLMNQKAIFTTYSSKGSVQRALKTVGFEVIKMNGPKGKREMINAIKI